MEKTEQEAYATYLAIVAASIQELCQGYQEDFLFAQFSRLVNSQIGKVQSGKYPLSGQQNKKVLEIHDAFLSALSQFEDKRLK